MKAIIIKWNPLHSSVSMVQLCLHIAMLKSGHIAPLINMFYLPEVVSSDTRFYLLKCGYSQNGICASGIVSKMHSMQSHTLDCNNNIEYYAELHFNHYIDPNILPIMPKEDLIPSLSTYNWNNEENIVLSEEDSDVMEDLWMFYLSKTYDLLTNRENAMDSYYCNNHISLEKPSTYTAKDILIKWAPKTSALKIEMVEKFRQQTKAHPSFNENKLSWRWPMIDPSKFSRYDRIFVVLQTESKSGLFYAGYVCSSLRDECSKKQEEKTWIFCDTIHYIYPFYFHHSDSPDIYFSLEDIALIVPDLEEDEEDQEIILTKQQGRLLGKLLKPDYVDPNELPF